MFFARTLLRYSQREAEMLLVYEICEQFEEYCRFNKINTDNDFAEEAL